ncbi:hypothetical protein CPB84DRAFT_1623949, partial [Gymnopilus junonius]
TQIAIDLNMSLHIVQCVLVTWREIGEVCRDRRGFGRSPILKNDAVKLMLGLLEHSPDLYLDEIQEQLEEQHGVETSLSTISKMLKCLGMHDFMIITMNLTHSSSFWLSKVAQEHSEEAQCAFVLAVGNEPPEWLVTADESAVNILTSYHQNGW